MVKACVFKKGTLCKAQTKTTESLISLKIYFLFQAIYFKFLANVPFIIKKPDICQLKKKHFMTKSTDLLDTEKMHLYSRLK